MAKKPVMLMVLDGWGINENANEKNAIAEVNPKVMSNLLNEYPNSRIKAAGEAVGLPEGQMGNSEVGHLNLGAGRVVYQPLVKISLDVKNGDIANKTVLKAGLEEAKTNGTAVHFGGLLSDGGVHSHIDHLIGLVKTAKEAGIEEIFVHAFLDGRDTPPKSALKYIETLENAMEEIGAGKIATVSGRYFSMDRDNNYDRTKEAYDAMVNGIGATAKSAKEAVEACYMEDKTDEFVTATVIEGVKGQVKEGDIFVNFNFRPDRARQITRAINDKEFTAFERTVAPVKVLCMRQYDSSIDAPVIYEDELLKNTLGEVLANNNLTQLRTAETEKYAHVTFFFNGGVETELPGEERLLVASPKVATYDLQPEMSAYELTDKIEVALDEDKYDVVVMNYANPDMVGHTGNYEAAKKAVEVVDECVARVVEKVLAKDGHILITADHGNVDLMVDPETGAPFTAHTTNEVPFILVSNKYKGTEVKDGKLADFAPTILDILGVEIPDEMTGESLLVK